MFMQSATTCIAQQAARRSWRIGQKLSVRVIYLGYAGSSQMTCLELMARRSWSRSPLQAMYPNRGSMSLNQDGDSVEVALARQLVTA